MFVDELSTEQQEALASICDLDCDIADIGTMVTTLDGVVCDCTLLECCGAECAFSLVDFTASGSRLGMFAGFGFVAVLFATM
eukprot:UN13298